MEFLVFLGVYVMLWIKLIRVRFKKVWCLVVHVMCLYKFLIQDALL